MMTLRPGIKPRTSRMPTLWSTVYLQTDKLLTGQYQYSCYRLSECNPGTDFLAQILLDVIRGHGACLLIAYHARRIDQIGAWQIDDIVQVVDRAICIQRHGNRELEIAQVLFDGIHPLGAINSENRQRVLIVAVA